MTAMIDGIPWRAVCVNAFSTGAAVGIVATDDPMASAASAHYSLKITLPSVRLGIVPIADVTLSGAQFPEGIRLVGGGAATIASYASTATTTSITGTFSFGVGSGGPVVTDGVFTITP
jgi:hypothetical protein